MVYLLVNVLIAPGSMTPETREFAAAGRLPFVHDLLGARRHQDRRARRSMPRSSSRSRPASFVWVFLWHTPWGFELRAMGHNAQAAAYAGIKLRRVTMLAMCLSGALAGFVGVNEIVGVHHRVILNFTAGYGFGGIAVALMGRNHPVGVVLASLLFGALYQGGAELAFEIPQITKEMVVVIQGLVILFSGALANMPRPWFANLLAVIPPRRAPAPGKPDGGLVRLAVLILSATLRVATPLILCALGALFCERAASSTSGSKARCSPPPSSPPPPPR